MIDYKEMYLTLFRETTKAVATLQRAQQQTEEMYLAGDTENKLLVISPTKKEKGKPPQE